MNKLQRLMIGRILTSLIAGLFPIIACAAPPCPLSKADYDALAHANYRALDGAAVVALSAKDAKNLCKARAFMRKARKLAGGKTAPLSDADVARISARFGDDELPTGITHYVSDAEWEFVRPVSNQIAMVSMGMAKRGVLTPNTTSMTWGAPSYGSPWPK